MLELSKQNRNKWKNEKTQQRNRNYEKRNKWKF